MPCWRRGVGRSKRIKVDENAIYSTGILSVGVTYLLLAERGDGSRLSRFGGGYPNVGRLKPNRPFHLAGEKVVGGSTNAEKKWIGALAWTDRHEGAMG